MTVPIVVTGAYERAINVGMNPAHMEAVLATIGLYDAISQGKIPADGVSSASASIEKFAAIVGPNGTMSFTEGRYHITRDTFIPSNVQANPGAIFAIDTGCHLVFQAGFARPTWQVFDCGDKNSTAAVIFATPAITEIDGLWFGTNGDGDVSTATQNTAAMRATLRSVNSSSLVFSAAAGGPGADSYSTPWTEFGNGHYKINDTLPLSTATAVRMDRNALIEQIDPTKDVWVSDVASVGYLNAIEQMQMLGGRIQFNFTRAPSDTGLCKYEDVWFLGSDPTQFAVDVTLPGAELVFVRPRVVGSPKFLRAQQCDVVTIEDPWVRGDDPATKKKPANTASYEFHGSVDTGTRVEFRGGIHVPEDEGTVTNAQTRWIDMYDYVSIVGNTMWSGENGGFPIVYNFASAAIPAGSPFGQIGGVAFSGCQVSSGGSVRTDRGVVVLKTSVPPGISVRDCFNLFDGYVINDLIPGGVAAWLASITDASHPRLGIIIENVRGAGAIPIGQDVGGVPTALAALNAFAQITWVQNVGGPNVAQLPKGLFPLGATSGSGVTPNTASGVFATMFAPTKAGMYFVTSQIPAAGNPYMGIATVLFDGTNVQLQTNTVGANTGYQLSGTNVQVKQTSGGSSTVAWSYLFVPIA